MKNIHLLKTSKPSKLLKDLVDKTYQFKKEDTFGNRIELPLNIYITSDEEIKEGDWVTNGLTIMIANLDGQPTMDDYHPWKKIILTTDQDLIKDGVQAIDDEFLEWFVKNPSCEFVEINKYAYAKPNFGNYKIIIPKEEPKQRLEKYSERFDNKDNEIVEGVFNPDTWGKRVVEEPKQELPGINGQTFKIVLKEKWFPKQETLEEVVSKQFQEDFNKEVGKVLTQELQKRESETPVEWIYRNLLENPISNQDVEYNEAVFHNAKEMEKEQDKKLYSEEEVRNIVEQTIEKFYKHRYVETKAEMKEQWFEQFKKK
jgi:hypothetical protein